MPADELRLEGVGAARPRTYLALSFPSLPLPVEGQPEMSLVQLDHRQAFKLYILRRRIKIAAHLEYPKPRPPKKPPRVKRRKTDKTAAGAADASGSGEGPANADAV